MNHEFSLSWQENQMRFERLANLLFLNTFLNSSLPTPRTPFKIFVNSIPKSGTNLLMKTLRLFPTIRDSQISLHSEMTGTPWRPTQPLKREVWKIFPSVRTAIELGKMAVVSSDFTEQEKEDRIKIGGFHDVFVPTKQMENLFSYLKSGWFATGHMPFSHRFDQLLSKNGFKMILILRDPRDVINSELNFFLNTKKLALHKPYQELTRDEGIMSILHGFHQNSSYPKQPSIRNVLLDYMPWLRKPYVYVTTFEGLVGSLGGGNSHTQTEEVMNIAQHLELSLSEQELEKIKRNSFGGTHTFRKGTIGSWKEKFTIDQKLACKQLLGDLLIELGYESNTDW